VYVCAVFSVSVDYAVCGVAALGEYLVILFHDEQLAEDVCSPFDVVLLCKCMHRCLGQLGTGNVN